MTYPGPFDNTLTDEGAHHRSRVLTLLALRVSCAAPPASFSPSSSLALGYVYFPEGPACVNDRVGIVEVRAGSDLFFSFTLNLDFISAAGRVPSVLYAQDVFLRCEGWLGSSIAALQKEPPRASSV